MTIALASVARRRWSLEPLLRSPIRLVSWIIVLILTGAIVYPMLVSALIVFQPGHGDIGLERFLQVDFVPVMLDTLFVCVGSAVPAVVIGVLLAWAHERTDAQLGFIGDLLPMSALIVPQIAGVVGWIVLFDPKIGYANMGLRWLLDWGGIEMAQGPFNIFHPVMLTLLCSVYLTPYAFLLASTALQTLDSSVEEAARTCGASARRTFFTVTLPLLSPTLASIIILILMKALMMFGVVAALGTRSDTVTLPVYIYRLMNSYPSKEGLAMILSGALVLIILSLLVIEARVIKPGRYSMIGGKGNAVRRTKLGPLTNVVRSMAGLYLFVAIVLPALAVLLVSLLPFWSKTIRWDQLFFDNYASMFADPQVFSAIVNSHVLAAVGATLVVGLAVIITSAHKAASEIRAVNALTSLPAMIPHTLVGVAFIIAFSRPPFSLYGTTTLLLLAYIVMELPFIVQATRASAQSISAELKEASHVSGAGEYRTFWSVQVPLMASSMLGAWILAFIHIKGEITASALLTGATNPTLGPVMLNLSIGGTYNQLTALASFVTAISLTLVLVLLFIRRRSSGTMRIG